MANLESGGEHARFIEEAGRQFRHVRPDDERDCPGGRRHLEKQSGKGSRLEAMAEKLPLSKAAEYLLDECRMVLPGIQALFGFQLIAVFNARFEEKLSFSELRLHLLAI